MTYIKNDSDQEKIILLVAMNKSLNFIQQQLNIDKKDLKDNYSFELKNGHDLANFKVIEALYKNALNGNYNAQQFWLKIKDQWIEKIKDENKEEEKKTVNKDKLIAQINEMNSKN